MKSWYKNRLVATDNIMSQKKSLKNKKLVVLGVAAHPDDLDFGASGTFAKWARQGAECYYLICTDGSKGSDDPQMSEKKLVKMRQEEQIEAGKIIGLKKVFFLDHKDTELVADLSLKKEIVRYIRMLKPDIVVILDPTIVYYKALGVINHTDHRAAGMAALDAVYPMARDRLTFKELEKDKLMPHKVSELYLMNFEQGDKIVNITDTIDIKVKALRAHKSQINDKTIEMFKKRAAGIGRKLKFKYAESFVKLSIPK